MNGQVILSITLPTNLAWNIFFLLILNVYILKGEDMFQSLVCSFIFVFIVNIHYIKTNDVRSVECPGTICEGGCCEIVDFVCCKNNLFCAKEASSCVDYSRGKSILTQFKMSYFFYLQLINIIIKQISWALLITK